MPRPHLLRCRASTPTCERLRQEAEGREMTCSGLIAEILDAYARNERIGLPHNRPLTPAAYRELARIGNNVNQIARQANVMRLHLLEKEARACLATINQVLQGERH